MFPHRTSIVICLIAGLIASGCETQSSGVRGDLISEYRAPAPPKQIDAPYSAVYVLWEWTPDMPITTQPARSITKATRERAFELREVYTARGTALGFSETAGQLLATAGQTVLPLDAGHYTWNMLPGNPSVESDRRNDRIRSILNGAIIVIAFVSLVGIVGVIIDTNRHTLPVVNLNDYQDQ